MQDLKTFFYCFRSGAATGSSRAGTPSRASSTAFEPTNTNNSTTASILAEADRRRELRNYVFNPVGKAYSMEWGKDNLKSMFLTGRHLDKNSFL